jgi:hypothetical protein
MAIGDTRTITFNTAKRLALVTFDGEAGQRCQLQITNVTFQPSAFVFVFEPHGTALGAQAVFSSGGLLTVQPLPVTGTYTIELGPAIPGTGSLTVALGFATPPANDDFNNAQIISGSAGTVTGSNVGATVEVGEPVLGEAGESVWYRWTASTSGTATIDTFGSSFDTALAVYTGNRVSYLNLVAVNDNAPNVTDGTSQVSFNAVAGTVYQITVDLFHRPAGSIVLNWNLVP